MVEKTKVDLYNFLAKINAGDVTFLNSLSAEDKKSLAPVVVMQWLTGTNDKQQIVLMNHLVNPLVFKLYKHQDLLFKLMMASCTKPPKRFAWIKTNKVSKHPLSTEVISQYYKCSTREAEAYYPILSKDDILEMWDALGNNDKELLAKLKKE